MPAIPSKLTALAAIGAAGLGGAAIANAASSGTSTTSSAASSSGSAQTRDHDPAGPRDPAKGGHMNGGKTEALLTGDTAAKVKAAAEAKVSGATVERVENDVDTGSPYEAHMRKSDGSEIVVYVDSNFKVTGTDTMHGHP
ncbi:MAG: hypothetical protein QOG15_695 [Solirubrobacteraceae bacterium]|jgi:uncharacterized membrane protein YkoI|nr:hypothetical protein [Solirubrobacteraceae bacterium]